MFSNAFGLEFARNGGGTVPEPATWLLSGLAIAALGATRRARR